MIKKRKSPLNIAIAVLLRILALQFNLRPALNKMMRNNDGWNNFTIGFTTETGSIEQAVIFHNGSVSVTGAIPYNTDVKLTFINEKMVIKMLKITPNEVLGLILNNQVILDGHIGYLQLFNFYVSLLMGKTHQKKLDKILKKDSKYRKMKYKVAAENLSDELKNRNNNPLKCTDSYDKNVKFLSDPYLSEYKMEDFPRLVDFLNIHFEEKPEVCDERPHLLTTWYRQYGFESDCDGIKWNPVIRQAKAFKYLMENKMPVIRANDLLAGTTTSKDTTGVIIYPDAQGGLLWGELNSVGGRVLNQYKISDETRKNLHKNIFPFWTNRNFKEWTRKKFNYPLSQKIEERWVTYFVWKSVGISHTIPDFPLLLKKGTKGIICDIEKKLSTEQLTRPRELTLEAMRTTLEGLVAYSLNLSKTAIRLMATEADKYRKSELKKMADISKKVPESPPETLDEAMHCIWILWIAMHMENTNTGLSLGRLDQWLQPYFERDINNLETKSEKEAYIKHVIEITGCFFMRCTDHLPLVPDIGNYLFGGSSSDQAITLGGVTPEGEDGVNDMSYILLKVTEMLSIRDPNVNARFTPEVNSDAWLKRMCEVNYTTAATPSMHNDISVFKSLEKYGYAPEDVRDWSATGCVEPTLTGKHMGHTGSILMNIVAGLEMAMNQGKHPLMNWQPGPAAEPVASFTSFDMFFEAYKTQQQFLIDNAVELNNMLAEIHAEHRPTPLLSTFIEGAIEQATDVTEGGAKYNSSGTSNIGLADVTDSMMAIKKLVFDENLVSFSKMKSAVDTNFENNPEILALIRNKVPLFGSGNPEALEMANRITGFIHSAYSKHKNYRSGPYTTGFWSMSQHVAYGNLSGALPSGRGKGKAFTPGLTPNPGASKSFLDNIRDVAQLDSKKIDNNMAFNVKLIPDPKEKRENTINTMLSYAKAYFDMGGMQMQFNVVTSETLKDAMANPANYRNLLVRISGYNAYFTTLNSDMQIELIERAEYGIT